MRVAFITTFSSHYRRPLFEELARRWDADFMFFSLGEEWYRSTEMVHEPGEFRTVALRPRLLRGAVYAPDLPTVIASGGYDVVIKCLNGKLMVPLAYSSARRAGVPIIMWTGMWDHPATPVHTLTRPLVRALYRRADATVAYGAHVKAHLVEDFGVDPDRVFVAGQAVEGDRFTKAAQGGPSPQTVLYVGQLEERKGIRYLVEAFRSMPGDELRLRLVGSGSLGPWIEQQARLDRRIELVGYRSQAELPSEYAQARCLVLPSVHTSAGREPWGLVVNEAMHTGRPVVATESVGAAAGGLVVNDRNGYVISERDTGALAQALHRLLGNEDLAGRLGAQAAIDVKRFSYAGMADAFDEACAFTVSSTGGRRRARHRDASRDDVQTGARPTTSRSGALVDDGISRMRSEARVRIDLVGDREGFVVTHCAEAVLAGGDVAHLGCTDSPFTNHRLASGDLLHARLLAIGPVVGFDVDTDALKTLIRRFPLGEFVADDVCETVREEHRGRYRLVIAGEVLEHVSDPGRFLRGCRALLRPDGRLMVTVPNACSPKIGLRALAGLETVHPDHHTYYGPRTLTHALLEAGLEVDYLASYLAIPGPLGRIANTGLRVANRFTGGPVGEGLITLATPVHDLR
jgi:glycosyltransferase involved in cell wall biosynthesis/SAM-dependent methyltransferase